MKKLYYVLVIMFTSTLLSACVAPSSPYWYKKGVSKEETHTYYQQCVYDIGMNKLSLEKEIKLQNACMEKAGFRWVVD